MASSTLTYVPPEMENFIVGIIGMGDMGKMYARRLSDAGWKFCLLQRSAIPNIEMLTRNADRIRACDREEQYEDLCKEFSSRTNIQILRNGHLVSRASDYVIYSVEAAAISRVVAEYGPSTKQNAIVGGQTSCKSPEIQAFEDHLPPDVDIVSCHSLHGPKVDTKDQPLVLIKHRASDISFHKVETVLRCLQSKHVYLTAHEHDRITADTQAVTHAAFLTRNGTYTRASRS
ncbi:hypothetical protein NPX13_g9866 [Xylaria arbuscula]|uniref:Prephenate/arogenate dehydrogenase domain-containing protein n=1 Tax=Xylaria arbuscula TaxID=114810 RepID=A0A9W8N5L2_9PEZI|nr:hypothetical protein NPX13_g9866 [Xylaria arbuscula]